MEVRFAPKMTSSKNSAYQGKKRSAGGSSEEIAGRRITEPLPKNLRGKYGKVKHLPDKKK